MVKQTSGEFAVQDGLLVFYEHIGTAVHKSANNAGAQVRYFLVRVIHTTHCHLHFCLSVGREKSHEVFNNLGRGEHFKFCGIFQVHNLIADVVCRLHQVYQRMPCESQGPFGRVEPFDA